MARRKKKKAAPGKPAISENQQPKKIATPIQDKQATGQSALPEAGMYAQSGNLPDARKTAAEVAALPAVTGEPVKSRKASAEAPKTAARKAPAQPRVRHGVSWLTCIAGMFLTFVLGTYIGTLLPGVLQDMQEKQAKPVEMPSQPVQQESAAKIPAQLQRHIDELEKKTALEPASVPSWISLGNLYFDAGLPNKAIPAYEKALALAPDNADVLTDLGIMYRETGHFQKAVECFRKAIAIDPGHQNAMFNEGVVLAHDLHKPQEAASAWERLLGVNPNAKSPSGVPLPDLIRNLKSQ